MYYINCLFTYIILIILIPVISCESKNFKVIRDASRSPFLVSAHVLVKNACFPVCFFVSTETVFTYTIYDSILFTT